VGELQSTRQRFYYSFGRIGGGVYDGFNTAILSLYLGAFTNNNFLLGYLSNSRTMEGVVIQPLIGRWSDRTVGRFGRRRPFILAAAPISTFFLLLVPPLGHTHTGLTLPLVAAAIILFSIAYNIAGDPYDALMVDITPPRRRPTFNAILNVVSLLGYVGITLYAAKESLKENTIPDSVFYFAAVAVLLGYAVVFFGVREPQVATEEAQNEERIPLRAYVAELRTFREALKFLLCIFFFWNGILAMLPYLNRFMTKTIGVTDSQALLVFTALILTSAIFAYPFGWLGARFGNRRFIGLGCAILVLASIVGLVVPSYGFLYPLAMLAGCGYAAANALLYPYLAGLVPESKIGVFTGLKTAFAAIATPISVVVTSMLIDVFGYRSIFAIVAVMMFISIGFLLSIDEGAAAEQIGDLRNEERALPAIAAPAPS
jgi:maltose/moltooligosaccharide transporter